jgi:2'-5' RNA ligase
VWTRELNLHITAYFIGNIEQENFHAVSEILRGIAIEQVPFVLEFEKISLAPELKKPRMIWLRFLRNELFTDLSNRMHLALRKFIPQNPYHFREPIPHVTLARFNSTFDTSLLDLDVQLEIPAIQVNHCELWESIPGPEGARYISIEKFPMRPHS